MGKCFKCGRPYDPNVLFTEANPLFCPECQLVRQTKKSGESIVDALRKVSSTQSLAVVDRTPQMAEVLRPHLDAVIEGHRRAASGLMDLSDDLRDVDGTIREGTRKTLERLDEAQVLRQKQAGIQRYTARQARELVDIGHEQIGFSRTAEEARERLIDLGKYQTALGLRHVEQGDETNARLANIISLAEGQTREISLTREVLSDQLEELGDVLGDILAVLGTGLKDLANEVIIARMELAVELRNIEGTLQQTHRELMGEFAGLARIMTRIADNTADIRDSLRNPAQRAADEAVRIAIDELRSERWESAKRKYEEAQRADPRDVRIYLGLGWVGIHQGNVEAASRSFIEAKERAEKSGRREDAAEASKLLGRIHYSLENYSEAARSLGEAVKLDRDDLEARFRQAEYLCLAGNLSEAEQVLSDLIARDAKFLLKIRLSSDLEVLWPKLKGIVRSLIRSDRFKKILNLSVLAQQSAEFGLDDETVNVLKHMIREDFLSVLKSGLLLDYRFKEIAAKIAFIVEQVCGSLKYLQSVDYYSFAFVLFQLGCLDEAYSLFLMGTEKDVFIIRRDADKIRRKLREIGKEKFVDFIKNRCREDFSWLASDL